MASTKALRNKLKNIKFTEQEIAQIERGCHYYGIETGMFLNFSQFVRGCALAKSEAVKRNYNRHRRSERLEDGASEYNP